VLTLQDTQEEYLQSPHFVKHHNGGLHSATERVLLRRAHQPKLEMKTHPQYGENWDSEIRLTTKN